MKRREQSDGWVARLCNWLGRQTRLAPFLDWVAGWFMPRVAWRVGGLPAPRLTGPTVWKAQGPLTTPNGDCQTCRNAAPTTPGEANQDNVQSPDRPGVLSEIWHWIWGTSHQAKKDEADRKAGKGGCADPKYHGMHGRPCRFAGGSDLKCPAGTTSGWFWSYETPVGRFFYVDCCGGTPQGSVWCNWTQEANWCMVWGKAANAGISDYNCTLAIPDSLMKTRDIGGGKYEVVGVD